jgi:hypothetical protein
VLKRVANHQNLENIFKSAMYTMRDGLIEYMRACVEELVDVSHSARYFNLLAHRNSVEGTRSEYRCLMQSSLFD